MLLVKKDVQVHGLMNRIQTEFKNVFNKLLQMIEFFPSNPERPFNRLVTPAIIIFFSLFQ